MSEIIKYKNVDLYQAKEMVLMNIDFTVEHGEFIYLIGKTGSGKSSLLKSLYGDIPIKNGEAEFLNYNLIINIKQLFYKHLYNFYFPCFLYNKLFQNLNFISN